MFINTKKDVEIKFIPSNRPYNVEYSKEFYHLSNIFSTQLLIFIEI